jgi:molybdate transport system ATP-binding protein
MNGEAIRGGKEARPALAAGGALAVDITRAFASELGAFRLDVAFTAPSGVTILFGPSGSGKTSILDCASGLTRPDRGRIALGERTLFDSEKGIDLPAAQRSVGYVFQTLALFPHLSVEDNVAYGLAGRGARRERVRAVLESFGIAPLRRRRPGEVSGGERQRAALARALVLEPDALLLDEPLAALDLPTKSRILDDLRAWNRRHSIPILYVTHSRREAYALGEHVVVLEEGEVAAHGLPHEVFDAPRRETVASLAGFENIFAAEVLEHHEEGGTMTCRLQGSEVRLEVPLAHFEPSAHLRVAVRAGDVLLSTARPEKISARNILPGRVRALEKLGHRVEARIDCGAEFRVDLTTAACAELELAPGREVWLVLKTYSCHLVR